MPPACTHIAVALVAALSTGALYAAPQALPLTVSPGLNSLDWTVGNTSGTTSGTAFLGDCNGSVAGLGTSEATSASGATDAYDSAFMLFVDDTVFVAPATVDVTGELLTAGPVTLSDLNATVEMLFPAGLQAARIRAIFSNPTANPITVDVDVPLNLGADATTQIEQTSTGDNVFSTADRWVVTSDSSITTEPVVTTVLYGPGTPTVAPSSVTRTVCSDGLPDPDGIGFSFTLTVPGNTTRSLMFFAGLGDIQGTANTVAGALTFVTMFDRNTSIDSRLLSDLTDAVRLQILNWDFAATTVTSISSEDEEKTLVEKFIGCSLGEGRTSDPVLAVLVLLAIGGLYRARSRASANTQEKQL